MRQDPPAWTRRTRGRAAPRPTSRPGAACWLTLDEVAARTQLSLRTIERLMRLTRTAGLAAPWIKLGRAVRFEARRVDLWLYEVSAWRASKSAARDSGSAGGTPPGGSAPTAAEVAPPPTPSGAPSSRPGRKAATGTLKELAERLCSAR